MFYKLIERKRNIWLDSHECTINDLLKYISNSGKLRDAQIDAIKTYLFLKIACQNRPLWELFSEGFFIVSDTEQLEVKVEIRRYLEENPGILSLYEYASLKNDSGEQVSVALEKVIRETPSIVDYVRIFKEIFYGVSYTDYLFSLPMGAGKTYLMAVFIYLDLYFSINEPDNRVFSHNFIIFAPSGLKSSVVPSLKTIQSFDPSWVLPEPAASNIKKLLKFEVLDQSKTTKNSNKTKNPNVQKIAIHHPLQELIGLVVVTNAEKVILDRVNLDPQLALIERSDDEKDRQSNELRHLIGRIPNLSIFIDEVHHATDEDIKLRAVVNKWAENNTVNSVIGFTGTPYLEKAAKTIITDDLALKSIDISNTVYYYPLINGIGNFLKRPLVKISTKTIGLHIIEDGVKDFLVTYKDVLYKTEKLIPKLAIYCGRGKYRSAIENLEKDIYPRVAELVSSYDLDPSDTILKYYEGVPQESKSRFAALDKSFSTVRIILLVQIGKEGWDCRSLTGVILSQQGDCPTNMVLQTSCRCLRQVERGKVEPATIWLNEKNAETLNLQLQKQQHIGIEEFQKGVAGTTQTFKRYNRTKRLALPSVDFYQLKVSYNTIITEEKTDVAKILPSLAKKHSDFIKIQDFEQHNLGLQESKGSLAGYAQYKIWKEQIYKEGFGFLSREMLNEQDQKLHSIYNKIVSKKGGMDYFNTEYDNDMIRCEIRKAFYGKRTLNTLEEIIPEQASLLNITNFATEFYVDKTGESKYIPTQAEVQKIISDDEGSLAIPEDIQTAINALKKANLSDQVEALESQYAVSPDKDRCWHYLPYKTDSSFEKLFLQEALLATRKRNLEVYYNGDSELTEFRIRCFKGELGKWIYIGLYTPDFLIIQRKNRKIYKVIIVETKGELYARDPKFIDRKAFIESQFLQMNNDKFGYQRFDYLYLEDVLTESERLAKAFEAINSFFMEEK